MFAAERADEREVGLVLPVGCGKSGCITLAPFAFKSRRSLVVAPNVAIAKQLFDDFDPTKGGGFYVRRGILSGAPLPEPAEIRGASSNVGDLEDADVVVTNIQQLQREGNRWLTSLPDDFFDLILFDEGHHNVAESWEALRRKFRDAAIVNFSATPLRSDGSIMAGRILYSYPIFKAIERGYVKRLRAVVLNPRSLRYVRRDQDREIEVDLDEVRRLGEQDAEFRRSIVTSKESLATIVSASIRELNKLRTSTGESRLKIIASALNFDHCSQIVEEYRARGLRADYVHSREEGDANQRVMQRLERHDLDVIVQVRKLGEGFDHPYLAVAAVFSVFSNLSPFVQFVGRIMRVVKQDAPGDPVNHGVVVFHAGANVARRWSDFQEYSQADQDYFDQLLPMEEHDLGADDEVERPPPEPRQENGVEVQSQSTVDLQEIPLLRDEEAMALLRQLRDRGYTGEEVSRAMEELEPVPETKQHRRRAMRSTLDVRVKNAAMQVLGRRGLNPEGKDLDRQRRGRSNLVVVKATIDGKVNALVGCGPGERAGLKRAELERINEAFDELVQAAEKEVFGA